jgi:carbonic anhydrase
MSGRLTLCVVLALLGAPLAGCGGDSGDTGGASEGPAWNHDPANAELGPNAWGGIDASFEQCRTGDRQSPVAIAKAASADLPALEFDYPATTFVVKNTGHTIEATMPESSNLTLSVGKDVYRLVQFHFHAPSEHTAGGIQYPAELHLVHESPSGEVAVVAIFLEPSSLPSPLIDEVIESAGSVGEEVPISDDFTLSLVELLLDLEPPTATVDGYWAYPGSLTMPGCTEGVRWIVLQDIRIISDGAVSLLHDTIAGFPDYDGYPDNNRPTQPLNGRAIQRDGG